MHLGLFFTFGMSLKKWHEAGILDREVKPYIKLQEKGIKISFLTFGDQTDFEYQKYIPNITIIPMGKMSIIKSLLLPLKFAKELKDIDIYKTNQMWGVWVPIFAKFIHKKKLYTRVGYDPYDFQIQNQKSFLHKLGHYFISLMGYQFADLISLTTPRLKDFVEKNFLIESHKIQVHSNYIDTDHFKLNGQSSRLPRVLFVGRLEKVKNLFNLLKACKDNSLGIDIIGEGSLENELKSFCKENKIDANFLGIIPNQELPKYYSKNLYYALTSITEGNPKTLLEAMSCESEVLATNVEGIKQLIQNRINGVLCGVSSKEIALGLKIRISSKYKTGPVARQAVIQSSSLHSLVRYELQNLNQLNTLQ